MQATGSENLAKAYAKAAKELSRHPLRVYSKDRLLEVSGFGPATSSVSPHPAAVKQGYPSWHTVNKLLERQLSILIKHRFTHEEETQLLQSESRPSFLQIRKTKN